jgi:glycerophosphoryl diester phosphodiesterase
MKLIRKTLSVGLALSIITAVSFCIYVHVAFQNLQIQHEVPASKSTWVHRGLYDNKVVFENTIASFDSAKKSDVYHGIELDVFYIDSLKDFFVTHDFPNGYGLPSLSLCEVLHRYQDSFYYWIDLKNLTSENKIELFNAFCNTFQKAKFTSSSKLFIESGNANALGYLASKKLNTIYWIQYNRDNFFKKFLKKLYVQYNFLHYDFKGATIGASMVDEDFKTSFRSIPKFIFHIYNPAINMQMSDQPNIAVKLIDYIPNKK